MEQENPSVDSQNITESLIPLDLNNFQFGETHKFTGSIKHYFPFGFFIRDSIDRPPWNRIESISSYCSTNVWRYASRTIMNHNLYSCEIGGKQYIIGKNCILDKNFNLLVYVKSAHFSSRFTYEKIYVRLGSFIDGRSEKNALAYFRSNSEHLEFVDDMSPFCFRLNVNFKTRFEKKAFDVKLTEICNNLLKAS